MQLLDLAAVRRFRCIISPRPIGSSPTHSARARPWRPYRFNHHVIDHRLCWNCGRQPFAEGRAERADGGDQSALRHGRPSMPWNVQRAMTGGAKLSAGLWRRGAVAEERMHLLLIDPAALAAESIGFDQRSSPSTSASARDRRGGSSAALRLQAACLPISAPRLAAAPSAQITSSIMRRGSAWRQVAAVVNFPPRQIGASASEVLTLGFPDAAGKVVCCSTLRARTASPLLIGSAILPVETFRTQA